MDFGTCFKSQGQCLPHLPLSAGDLSKIHIFSPLIFHVHLLSICLFLLLVPPPTFTGLSIYSPAPFAPFLLLARSFIDPLSIDS